MNFSKMYINYIFLLFTLYTIEAQNLEYITCGSVLKLVNSDYRVRLHSHDVNYGTGSGQQSVTATQQKEDVNSHWLLKGPTKKSCPRGQPVKSGDVIRLQHLGTNKNLHSHHFQSPLTDNQEVSAYGVNGEGDSGDHWTVISDGEFWEPEKEIMLRHVDTEMYLSVSGKLYGSPISGQMEVVGTSILTSVKWKAAEGIFIHLNEFNPKQDTHNHMHTEL